MIEKSFLKENERIDDLQLKDLQIIQNTKKFCFGMDAVLLADFAAKSIKKDTRVMDLGTGTGIIPLLVYGRTEVEQIVGLEIQSEMVEMAKRSMMLNDVEDTIQIIQADLKAPPSQVLPNDYDVIICNPPYMVYKSGLINPTQAKAVSRHEILCTLEDVLTTAKKYLKSKGKFYMIHRSERLVDVLSMMRRFDLEPKTIRFIHPSTQQAPNLLLVMGIKGGNAHTKIEKPLYVYLEDGEYTEEIYDIYQWKKPKNKGGGNNER